MPDAPSWLIDLPRCDSTSTWALQHLGALAHGACVHTAQQTAGRGRPGSTWHAPPGVLTASFVLDTDADAAPFALLAGLAVAHAVEDCMPGLRVLLKWPNDCLVADRKFAGVLCECTSGLPTRLVVGIGLNIDPRWDQHPASLPLASGARWAPTCLAEHGAAPQVADLLARLRRYLLEAAGLVAAGNWRRLLPELQARDALLGRRLRLDTASGERLGIGAGIDGLGRLLIRCGDATEAIASARHISLLASE